MRTVVFFDFHANQHALEAVWADIEARRPDKICCLGDLVGCGAYPDETTKFVRVRDAPTVMGNYDDGVGHDKDDCGCAYQHPDDIARGKASLRWTQQHCSPASKAFLRGLPASMRAEHTGQQLLFVHGSLRSMNEHLFAGHPETTFERIAGTTDCDFLFFGHTHLPYQKQVGDTLIVNTGSVGKPKDGDPRAGYVLLTLAKGGAKVEFWRVDYDVAAAARTVRMSGLPHDFAIQLETGGQTPVPA